MNRNLMRLVYRSVPTRSMSDEDIDALVARSASANAAREITGALLHDGIAFGQVLEGPAGEIEAVYEKISCDRRHRALLLLEYSSIASRTFDAWSMAVVRGKGRVACLGMTRSDGARQIVETLAAALSPRSKVA
jgi:hypothetical protein